MTEEAVNEDEKTLNVEKPAVEDTAAADGDKEGAKAEVEEKEPEDKVKEYTYIYT